MTEKLFQVPSERAQSPRGEREKEGERINRKNYFHTQLGEGSLCAGLVRGELEGTALSPLLLCSPSFIFSAPSAKRVTQPGAGMLRSTALWSGTLTLRWTRWTDGQEICRCSPKMSLLRFNPFCAGRATSAAVTLLYWRIQCRGRCGVGCHKGGSHRVGVLLLSQGFSMGSPTSRSPPLPDLPAAGGSSRGQGAELRVFFLSFAPKLIFLRQVGKRKG